MTQVPVDPVIGDVQDATTTLVKTGEAAVEIAAETAEPWLNTIGLKQLFEDACDWFVGLFLPWLRNNEAFAIIDLTEAGEANGYNAQVRALAKALSGGADLAKLQQARTDYEASLERLGHLTGTGSQS